MAVQEETKTLNPEELKSSYKFEDERIKTFSLWKFDSPVDPVRLAKAGFYYTGNKDEVVCFSCKGHVKNWNYGDIVQKKHSELFPNCNFVNNCSNNVPSKNSRSSTKYINEIKLSSATSSLVFNEIDKMRSLEERLKSFTSDWPLQNFNIESMAEAGFFYLGNKDKVQCPFCKGIVSNWEINDDPLKEHAKHFPDCKYLSDIQSNLSQRKVPKLQNDSENNVIEYVNSSLKPRLLDETQEHFKLKKLGVLLHSVSANPSQASFNSRMQSFLSWNSPVSIEALAKAGFFYIGIKDHTKCFHCNGGLCNWEFGDDPWVEHARWFRNCGFLHLTKGISFIEECIDKKSKKLEVGDTHQIAPETLMQIDKTMESPIVKKVLETNLFPQFVIRSAVICQIKATGHSFSTIEELCTSASSLKNDLETELIPVVNYQNSSFTSHNIDIRKDSIDSNIDTMSEKLHSKVPTRAIGNARQSFKVPYEETKTSTEDCYLCVICMEQKVEVVFLPCGHLLSCTECASALKYCAICRKTIQATVRAYLP